VDSQYHGDVGQGCPVVQPGPPGWESVSNHNATSPSPATITTSPVTMRSRVPRRICERAGALIAVVSADAREALPGSVTDLRSPPRHSVGIPVIYLHHSGSHVSGREPVRPGTTTAFGPSTDSSSPGSSASRPFREAGIRSELLPENSSVYHRD
jgi:hypothetical protein